MTDWSFDFVPGPPRVRKDQAPREGLVAGRYELLDEVGRGAGSTVSRARDRETGRLVALKLIRGTLSRLGAERLRREALLLQALDHPGIVRVLDAGEARDGPFLVTELVEGAETLERALPRLPRARRLELLLEIAAALGHAHERGVVHRDVKPANVLVDASGRARVIDLGAGWTREAQSLTQTGTLVGTPYYMAPEQVAGQSELGPECDVWALGVLLYQCLVDHRPFEGASFGELRERIRRDTPRGLVARDPSIPAALEAVCQRCLEKEPAHRYPHAAALRDALAAALEPPTARRRSRPGAVAALVPLAALLGAWLTKRDASPEPAPPVAAVSSEDAPPLAVSPDDPELEARLEARLRAATGPEADRAAVELARHLLLVDEDAAAALVPLAGRALQGDQGELQAFVIALTLLADAGQPRASSNDRFDDVVVDGVLSTSWCSAFASSSRVDEWVALDLGGARTIGALRVLQFSTFAPAELVIEHSRDGRTWAAVPLLHQPAPPFEAGWLTFLFAEPTATRQVRLRATRLTRDDTTRTARPSTRVAGRRGCAPRARAPAARRRARAWPPPPRAPARAARRSAPQHSAPRRSALP